MLTDFDKQTELGKTVKIRLLWRSPANGKPHIGHVLTRVIKDVIPHHSMKIKNVYRKMAGMLMTSVELEVERLLGLNSESNWRIWNRTFH